VGTVQQNWPIKQCCHGPATQARLCGLHSTHPFNTVQRY